MKHPILLLTLVIFFSTSFLIGQETIAVKPKALLIDEFAKSLNSEERSARMDAILIELNNNPNSTAVFVFYCGKTCFYGEFEAHVRGLTKTKLKPRNFDISRFVFVNGGYQKESLVRFWIVPFGAGIPMPESTVKFEDVEFKGIFKPKMVLYECCDFPDDYK